MDINRTLFDLQFLKLLKNPSNFVKLRRHHVSYRANTVKYGCYLQTNNWLKIPPRYVHAFCTFPAICPLIYSNLTGIC